MGAYYFNKLAEFIERIEISTSSFLRIDENKYTTSTSGARVSKMTKGICQK